LYVSDTLDETFLTTPLALMYGMLQSRLSRGLRNNIIGVNKNCVHGQCVDMGRAKIVDKREQAVIHNTK